jgi:hypothetical protein
MILVSLVLQFYVIGTMDALRAQMISSMGRSSATPGTNPLRASFDRLHTLSVRLEMAVLAFHFRHCGAGADACARC